MMSILNTYIVSVRLLDLTLVVIDLYIVHVPTFLIVAASLIEAHTIFSKNRKIVSDPLESTG